MNNTTSSKLHVYIGPWTSNLLMGKLNPFHTDDTQNLSTYFMSTETKLLNFTTRYSDKYYLHHTFITNSSSSEPKNTPFSSLIFSHQLSLAFILYYWGTPMSANSANFKH